MGYYIKSLSWKKSSPNWKVQFVSYKKSDIKDSNAKKPRKEWDVNPDRWRLPSWGEKSFGSIKRRS